jgi:trimethylamine---corrinoid protein Co-methyltransferase
VRPGLEGGSGFEKGVTTTIVALAGGNFVSECAGMLASLIGVSYEALVVDNDMLGSVMRTLRGIEVNEETLSVEAMREVASGAGHYLGHAETLEKMESEYLYPRIADRRSPEAWREAGALDIHEVARQCVRETLSKHYPNYIDPRIDEEIRALSDQAANGRHARRQRAVVAVLSFAILRSMNRRPGQLAPSPRSPRRA